MLNQALIARTLREQKNSSKYSLVEETDFSGYERLSLLKSDWLNIHISNRAITRRDIVYKAN